MIYTCELCGSEFLTEADPYIVRPTKDGVKLYCMCQIKGFEEMKGAEKLQAKNVELERELSKSKTMRAIAEELLNRQDKKLEIAVEFFRFIRSSADCRNESETEQCAHVAEKALAAINGEI